MTARWLTAVTAAARSARAVGAAVLIMSLAALSLPGCARAPAPPDSQDHEGNGAAGGAVDALAGQRFFPGCSAFLLAPDGRRLALVQGRRLLTFAVSTADELLGATPPAVLDLSGLGDGASDRLRPVAWCQGREGLALLVAAAAPDDYADEDRYYYVPLSADSAPRPLADGPLRCWWAFAPGAGVDIAAVRHDRGADSFAYCARPLDGLGPAAWQPAWRTPAGALLRAVRLASPTLAVAETYSEQPVAGGFQEESQLWRIDLTVDGAGAVQAAVAVLSTGLDSIDRWYPSPRGDAIVALGFRVSEPRACLVMLSGADPVDLGPCDVSWAGWSVDGRQLCYRTSDYRLRSYDLGLMTGKDVPLGSFSGGSECRGMPLEGERCLLWDGTGMAVVDGRTGATSFIARGHDKETLQVSRDGLTVAFVDAEAGGVRLVRLIARP